MYSQDTRHEEVAGGNLNVVNKLLNCKSAWHSVNFSKVILHYCN